VHLAGTPRPAAVSAVSSDRGPVPGFFNIVRVASDGMSTESLSQHARACQRGSARRSAHRGHACPPHRTTSHPRRRRLVSSWVAARGGDGLNHQLRSPVVGPVGHEDPFFAAPALIHGGRRRQSLTCPDYWCSRTWRRARPLLREGHRPGIALLQSEHLRYSTYKRGIGRLNQTRTSSTPSAPPAGLNLELLKVTPAPATPRHTRLYDDTGYQPSTNRSCRSRLHRMVASR